MHLTRRALLKALTILSAALAAPASGRPAVDGLRIDPDPAAVTAMVDAVLPADSSPGAVDIGIDASLIAHLRENANLRELYVLALDALYTRAGVADGSAFAALALANRAALLESLTDLDTPPGRPGRRVYNHARRFVMERYYASAAGQAAVDYRPPATGYPLPPDE